MAIVGAGAMGTSLAHAFVLAGIPVTGIASRTESHAQRLAGQLAIPPAVVSFGEICNTAPVVLIVVSDSAIESVAEQLQPNRDTVVAHASGFRDVTALRALEGRAKIGGFHPLAAVARGNAAQESTPEEYRATFTGGAFAIEGDDDTRPPLRALAEALGGYPFDINAQDKPPYHLGASMLAAFSAGLAQVTWSAMKSAGASDEVASAGTSHLLETVGRNVARAPMPAAIATGPIARGDVDGVRRQAIAAQAMSNEALALYRVHAAHNVSLARVSGRINDDTAQQMLAALDEFVPPTLR